MQSQLWMGSLEPNMTESFIMAALYRMDQRPVAVKVMRNKFTGEPAGYAFIHFQTSNEALDAMHKLNGKPIPGTFPVVRFRLNTATREARNSMQQEREFSIWVGDLSPDVDNYALYRVFSSKYSTIKTAKVIFDAAGVTKGYGFVRFGVESEQRDALKNMNGYVGLGTKPLKICSAVLKPKTTIEEQNNVNQNTNTGGNMDFSQYYDPSQYWQNYSAWTNYYGQNDQHNSQAQQQGAVPPVQTAPASAPVQNADLELVSYKRPIDIDMANTEFLNPDLSLWDSLEYSQWFPHDIVEAH